MPKVGTLAGLAPDVTVRQALRVLPKVTKAKGEKRATVGFLQGCVQRVFFGDVNRATLDVLAAEGFEVHSLREPRCCGALQLHAGDDDGAMALAKATIEAFERFDIVVTNAAGCGSAMKDYAHALRQEGGAGPSARRRSPRRSATSPSCSPSSSRGRSATPSASTASPTTTPATSPTPRACGPSRGRCCARSPAWRSSSPAEWEICCGSAGVYNLLNPEPARELGKRKLENLRATGADVIVAANPGCALQINSAATEEGAPLRILHPIEVLAASIAKRSLTHMSATSIDGVTLHGELGPDAERVLTPDALALRGRPAPHVQPRARAAPARAGWSVRTRSPRAARSTSWRRRRTSARATGRSPSRTRPTWTGGWRSRVRRRARWSSTR